jgi:hypothetical protein
MLPIQSCIRDANTKEDASGGVPLVMQVAYLKSILLLMQA